MDKHRYTAEEIEFLRKNIKKCSSRRELADMFNEHFNLQLVFSQINQILKHYKICRQNRHYYTSEEINFLKNNAKNYSRRELSDVFNNYFNLQLTFSQIDSALKDYGICNGRSTNLLPIGTESSRKRHRFIVVKTAKSEWRYKHHIVWEKANGAIPKGHIVIFGDGNHFNFNPDNLMLISKKNDF